MNTRLLPGARLLTAWRSWTSERGLSPDAVERARDGGARPSRQRVAFAILALALLPVLLVMSRDFGVTWDESPRQANGERIWALYHGIPQAEKGYLYGGLFDVSAVALQHVLPLDKYLVRHLLNAFVGWLGIVGCGALAWRVAGPAVGSLAMLILALMPPYTGHAMNNPKDVPFAAAAVWALVAIAALPRERPVPAVTARDRVGCLHRPRAGDPSGRSAVRRIRKSVGAHIARCQSRDERPAHRIGWSRPDRNDGNCRSRRHARVALPLEASGDRNVRSPRGCLAPRMARHRPLRWPGHPIDRDALVRTCPSGCSGPHRRS